MEHNAESVPPMHVTFYRSHLAFPHIRGDGRADDIMVGVSPNGRHQAGNYEFSIEHVGTERGMRPIALRVQLFADSWRAFGDLPEFFALLASLDTSGNRPGPTLDDLTPMLLELGWVDETEVYAPRHTHIIGCITCRERVTAPAALAPEPADASFCGLHDASVLGAICTCPTAPELGQR